MIHELPMLNPQERALAEAIADRRRHPREAQAIIDEVAAIFDVTPMALIGPSRQTRLVDARCVIAMALEARGWMQTEIGDAIARDRATVGNLLRRMRSDSELVRLSKELAA